MKTKTYKLFFLMVMAICGIGQTYAVVVPCSKASCRSADQIVQVTQTTDQDIQALADMLNGTSDTTHNASTTISLDGFGDIISKIFMIQAYKYNAQIDNYSVEQYGSAVLVAKNLIITNAHVILDEEGNPLFNYEVCKTESVKKDPICFSSARLLVYDKKNDLALLQITNGPSITPVNFSTTDVQIGSKVDILGYPANGGNTITATQGTIAGFQNGIYKTDANLDEGNSGGGAFDQDHNFLGIPTFVVDGLSSMGYIIPLEKINTFIQSQAGTKNSRSIDQKFENYLKDIYEIKHDGTINTPIFSTPSFSDIGLDVIKATYKMEYNLSEYQLEDEDENFLTLRTVVVSKNFNVAKYVNASYSAIKSIYPNTQKTSKTIGSAQRSIISYQDDETVGYFYTQTNSKSNTLVEAEFGAEKANTDLLANMIEFMNGVTVKSSPSASKSINLPGIKLSTKWNISIFKQLEEGELVVYVLPNNKNTPIKIGANQLTKKLSDKEVKGMADMIKGLLSAGGISSTVQKIQNMYVVKYSDGEGGYGMVAIQAISQGGKHYVIKLGTEYTVKSYEKDILELFKKILPAPAKK